MVITDRDKPIERSLLKKSMSLKNLQISCFDKQKYNIEKFHSFLPNINK